MECHDLVYLAIILILGIVAIGSIFYNYVQGEETTKLKRDVAYYDSTYLSRQGGTLLWGDGKTAVNYNLRSFDGGKTWYAYEYGKNWELKILGEAETVYPGLMKTLIAWDKIKEHVDKNGPIKMSDLTPEFEKTLNDAKITIERK
jgi:hypothetical protein